MRREARSSVAVDSAQFTAPVRNGDRIAHMAKEAARNNTADKSATFLRDEIEAGPRENICFIEHNPSAPGAIKADAAPDSVRDGDGSRCLGGLPAGDRQHGDSPCRLRDRLDGDDQARTRLVRLDSPGFVLMRPKEMMHHDLTDLRRIHDSNAD